MKPYFYNLRYNFLTGDPIKNYFKEKLQLDERGFYYNYGKIHHRPDTSFSKVFIDTYIYFILKTKDIR